MRLDLLAALIEQQGLGTRGVDIFIHRMDAEISKGILLKLPIAGIDTDYDLPGYYKTDFQVIIRAQRQEDGDDLAKQLNKLLTMYGRDFTNTDASFAMQVKQMYPAKLPIVYPRSDGHGIEWSLNIHAAYVMT